MIPDKASFAVFSGVSSVTHDKLVDTVDENHRLKVATLKALKDMRDSCFGPNLGQNYKQCIKNFELALNDIYLEFGVFSQTNTMS